MNIQPGYSQTVTNNQTSNVGNEASFNQILQSNPQIPVNNTNNNSNNFNYPNIYPLNNLPNAYVLFQAPRLIDGVIILNSSF